jgi:transposase
VRSVPERIEDEEREQRLDRVAALDVGKRFGKVCTRVPDAVKPGKRVTLVWDVEANTKAITALAGHLVEARIERVVLESTSDYWRPFYYLFEAAGLVVWLVNAGDVKQVSGRPKTDKLDAVWLAKLNERGMLRPSFVPPVDIRRLRDYTRLRLDLTRERTRHKQRMEKLLEDALIKVSTVATDIFGVSGRDMIEALIAGNRDPEQLARLARGRLRVKHAALVQALDGRFDEHHAMLARMLLDQVDGLDTQIERLTTAIEQAIAAIPAAGDPGGSGGSGDPGGSGGESGPARQPTTLPAVARLDEIAGIAPHTAQVIIAEVGLNMTQFPTPAHLVSWAKLSPRTIQSGATHRGGKTGKGNPYLKGVLGEAAAAAAKTDTFLGERYRRLVKRRGKRKALVAVARSIIVAVWHLLADPTTRFHDLGPDHHATKVNTSRKVRNLVRQLEALGQTVTLQPAT